MLPNHLNYHIFLDARSCGVKFLALNCRRGPSSHWLAVTPSLLPLLAGHSLSEESTLVLLVVAGCSKLSRITSLCVELLPITVCISFNYSPLPNQFPGDNSIFKPPGSGRAHSSRTAEFSFLLWPSTQASLSNHSLLPL